MSGKARATYEDAVRFHGHSCPGLALGHRAASAAIERLGVTRAEDEELVAASETDSCALDALQVLTGCTAGKGNLIMLDYGKMAFTIWSRKSGAGVRVSAEAPRMQDPAGYDINDIKNRAGTGAATEEERRVLAEHQAARVRQILQMPDNLLLRFQAIATPPPGAATVEPSVRCAICGEKVQQSKAFRHAGGPICIPCKNRLTEIDRGA